MTGRTATGRPRQVVPFPLRALMSAALGLALCETAYRFARSGVLAREAPALARLSWPALLAYERFRAPFAAHPWLTLFAAFAILALGILGTRAALLFWHNQVVARVTGSLPVRRN